MADRPLSAPLPADLPENWEDNQIVAPSGASVGLSEQHGYNYLMEMVNRAHEAVNTINESFDNISGKRTCRAQLVQLVGGDVQKGGHLVDEGAGAPGAGSVHPLVDAAVKEDDLCILAPQLHHRGGVI